MRRRQFFASPFRCGGAGGVLSVDARVRTRAFTLLELLIVVGIIIALTALVVPAFTNLKSGNDVTSAANTIKGVLDTARTYAKANNTYTWVGFFEESVAQPSTTPAAAGIGRLVMSIVASKDGTMLYTGNLSSPVTLDPGGSTALLQINKLTKIDNVHLKTFAAGSGGVSGTFDTRPAVSTTPCPCQIGDNAPPTPSLTFHYPAGSSSPQYAFTKVVQFSPRGEAVVDNANYALTPIGEIDFEPTHGNVDPSPTPANRVAVQFDGIGGNVKIYKR
jgi:type II secretory pathway pseudopilin PulG